MRYLNKIVFINSSSIKYAEIELEGNVHFIGTQGAGKSTLLRTILFFYNANKTKLGIGREKKRFDDYYFEYQNSYIVYEVKRETSHYCVLAHKVNGKIAFRFIDSEYRREFFIDDNGRAYENWEKIRINLGEHIHYTKTITNYEEYRKIIYGDNKGLNSKFRKYSIIESKQYQNVPRAIQNVFLNSKLEAKDIKDTIIKSISNEDFAIDISNYHKSHLRDFETQINDLKIWSNKNKKGQITILNQANRVIDNYRKLNYTKREKKNLTIELAKRILYIDIKKPIEESNYATEKNKLSIIKTNIEKLKELHKKREQKIISKIELLRTTLLTASKKRTAYENNNIYDLIEKNSKKNDLESEKEAVSKKIALLTSKFSQINEKYKALILQAKNQQEKFINQKDAEINKLNITFSDEKVKIIESSNQLIKNINDSYKEQIENSNNELKTILEKENIIKRRKSELKYKEFYKDEIGKIKTDITQTKENQSQAKTKILEASNNTKNNKREWELEVKQVEISFKQYIIKEKETVEINLTKIEAIKLKISQSKSSFYGWLNDTIPNWENTIGKVIDENILFKDELSPELINDNSDSFYGVKINLNSIKGNIKSLKEYQNEINSIEEQNEDVRKRVLKLNTDQENELEKLKIKFRNKINNLKKTISENEYVQSQSERKLKKLDVELEEIIKKATSQKEEIKQNIENDLEKQAVLKQKLEVKSIAIQKQKKREINRKEKEKTSEIDAISKVTISKIDAIKKHIASKEIESTNYIEGIKKQQLSELNNKGADTDRLVQLEKTQKETSNLLSFIKANERTVIEYEIDKRNLFDNVPKFKTEKIDFENKQESIVNEHTIEKGTLNTKHKQQETILSHIEKIIADFEKDINEFSRFNKSEIFINIEQNFNNITVINEEKKSKTACLIINDLKDKYYQGITILNELKKSINLFSGNFNEQNIFKFKVKLTEDYEFLDFATELIEFIEEDKISEFEKRVNERFVSIIQLIGRETTDLISKEAEIEKIIRKINNDFIRKNFVDAIKVMEMKTQKSSNTIVKLLIQIKEFNDENSLMLGGHNLFTTSETSSKNQKAVDLLKKLVKELEKSKKTILTLSESFDLQFRIIENDNDSGWVEKLSNVGSEGTDILVKAMINILLLNVFKENASRKFKDFKLHCMLDEIGRLHPNNVKGILRFANERNIFLINGSPTSQNATDYRYTYKLAKQQSKTDAKKYITGIKRLVKVDTQMQGQ